MKKNGNVLAAKCTCMAGKGAACSHCAALMFYPENLKRQGMASIPSDKTVPDQHLSASLSLEPLIIYQASKPSCLPDTVLDLADINPDCTVFKEFYYLYEEQQVLSEQLTDQIEMLTVTQGQCGLWHDLYNGRNTSCKFGQIVHRRETTDTRSIVGQLMGHDSSPSSLPQFATPRSYIDWLISF